MEQVAPIIFVLFALLAIALGVVGARQRAARKAALAAWAAARSLRFRDARDSLFDEHFSNFNCLRQGDDRYAYNIIEGNLDGRALLAFDYHYSTHSSDSKGRRRTHHHHFSAVILQPAHPLRTLHIRPENIFDKIGEFFGANDIDFESAEFSRRFCVKADDRKWAYDVLHARAIEFIMSRPSANIQFDDSAAILWPAGGSDIAGLEASVGTLAGLFDLFPEYLLQELRGPVAGEAIGQ